MLPVESHSFSLGKTTQNQSCSLKKISSIW